jgi:hypothetical protein
MRTAAPIVRLLRHRVPAPDASRFVLASLVLDAADLASP